VELRDYLQILWQRRWLVALCVAVAAGSALGFSYRITPTYAAVAKVFVGPRSVDKNDVAGQIQELTASREYVTSYAEMLRSRPLAEKVVQETGAPISPVALTAETQTRILPDTRLIEVVVTDVSPSRAQVFANELVKLFVEDKDEQFGGGSKISASVFEDALKPAVPVSPKPIQNGIIGGLLGLMLGVGVAFLLEQLDTTLRTKEDVEKVLAPVPVIATVPLAPLQKEWSIFMEAAPNSPQAEALRILRTNIQFFSVDRPIRCVLVTSPFAGDGKTTVAINLAAGIAATGSNVLLIETDLRKPVLAQYFDTGGAPGLSDILSGQADFRDAITRTRIPNLSIIASGPMPPNPSELLGSERMASLLANVDEMYDIVVLDSPPSLPVTDATILAPHTDGVILVVRAGQTQANKALDVVRSLERLEVRLLGVAVNGVERDSDGGYYYRYNYYRMPEQDLESPRRQRGREPAEGRDAEFSNGMRPTREFDDFVVGNVRPASRPSAQPAPSAARAEQDEDIEAEETEVRATVRPLRPQPGTPRSPQSSGTPPARRAASSGEARNADFRERLRISLAEKAAQREAEENGG
jgi:polysaccharide biosynthesis transport protein